MSSGLDLKLTSFTASYKIVMGRSMRRLTRAIYPADYIYMTRSQKTEVLFPRTFLHRQAVLFRTSQTYFQPDWEALKERFLLARPIQEEQQVVHHQ